MTNFLVLADITFDCDGFDVFASDIFIKSVLAQSAHEAVQIGQKYFDELADVHGGTMTFEGETVAFDAGHCYKLKAIQNVIVMA